MTSLCEVSKAEIDREVDVVIGNDGVIDIVVVCLYVMSVLEELGQYLTRPIIPLCFGLPLLLPASLLVAVAFLQDDIYLTLHVLGFVLLTMSVSSIVYGMVLGCRSKTRARMAQRRKRNVTVGFERTGHLDSSAEVVGTAVKKKRKPSSNVSFGSLTRLSSITSSPSLSRKSSLRSKSASSAPGLNLSKELVRLVDGKPEAVRPNRIYTRNNTARSSIRMGNRARPIMPAVRLPMTSSTLPPRPLPPSIPPFRPPKGPNKSTIELDLFNAQRAENLTRLTAPSVRSPPANTSRTVSRMGQRNSGRKGSNFLGSSPRRPSMASPRMLSVLEEEDMRREEQGLESTEEWSNDTEVSLQRLGNHVRDLGIGANPVSEDSTEMITSFGMSSADSAWKHTAQWIVSSTLGTNSSVPSNVRSSTSASTLVTESVLMSNLEIMYTLSNSMDNVMPRSVTSPLPLMVNSNMAANVHSSVHSTTLPLPSTGDVLALNTIVPPPPSYMTMNNARLMNMTLDGPNSTSENMARPISKITSNPSHFSTVNVNNTQSLVVMNTPAIKTRTMGTPLIPLPIVFSSSNTTPASSNVNPASCNTTPSSSKINPSSSSINPASSNTNPTSFASNPGSSSSHPPSNTRPPSSKLIHVVSSSNTPVISVITNNAPSTSNYHFQSHVHNQHEANMNAYSSLLTTKYSSVTAHSTLTMSDSNPFIVNMNGMSPGATFRVSALVSTNPQYNSIDMNTNNSDNSNTRNNTGNGNTRKNIGNGNTRNSSGNAYIRNNGGSHSKNAPRSNSNGEKPSWPRSSYSNVYAPLHTSSELAVHRQTLSPTSSQVKEGSAHHFRPTSSVRNDQDRARKEREIICNGHTKGPRATASPPGSSEQRDVDLF